MTTTFVRDVMSTAPVTVAPRTSIGDLLALFDRHDFNAFPVLDEHERLLGVVSKLDVLRAYLADRTPRSPSAGALAAVRVADVMSYSVISVSPHDPLGAAGDLMVETKLHSLLVVERRGGPAALVGIVSRGDVLRGLRFQLADDGAASPAPAP
jgi:CBS domain-containing protein